MTPVERHVRELLAEAGLRPTRQRVSLGGLLFAGGCRHVSAETLHDEASAAGEAVSLATVYNTLNAFTQAGLVRQVGVDGARVYFDTNTAPHHHFYDVDSGDLTDIPIEAVNVASVPEAPEGCDIESVEVIVRVKRAR